MRISQVLKDVSDIKNEESFDPWVVSLLKDAPANEPKGRGIAPLREDG
jgi:hypothetical protein